MESNCILTTHWINAKGYGQIKRAGVKMTHHRWVYCQHHKISLDSIAGKQVMHTCDTPACINPEHLVLGTNQDNVTDKMTKGRFVAYTRHKVLTPEQVEQVKHAWKTQTQTAIAKAFGVNQKIISKIIRGIY